jgi:hypothetical protein
MTEYLGRSARKRPLKWKGCLEIRHLQIIQERDLRYLGEVAMMHYKTLIGRRLHARTLPTQKTEAATTCKVLNIMTRLGMPVSHRIA